MSNPIPMSDSPYKDPSLRNPLATYLLSFFGVALGILALPRLLKYVTRRLVWGTIAEIVAIVLTAVFTEQAVNRLTGKDDYSDGHGN